MKIVLTNFRINFKIGIMFNDNKFSLKTDCVFYTF